MGFGGDKVQQFDPTPESIQGLQGDIADFLQGEFQNPGQTFGGFTSPLQRQALGGVQQFLGQPAPEAQVLQDVQPGLLQLINQGSQGIGGFDQSQALVGAAQPIFQRNLETALGSLSNSAPGRFGTAFAAQGRDLTSQALQDFNLFQQQALQSGLGLDLQARDLSQRGVLGASNLLGTLAGQAGQAPFNRLSQAGQLGLAATQQSINPTLQLLMGGLGFGRPMPQDAIVSEGIGSQLGGAASGALGGAAAGSVVPGIGTGIGALLGGLGGFFS